MNPEFDEAAEQQGFYRDVLRRLIEAGVMSRDMKILVVAGGETDRDVFEDFGFNRVLISNLDDRLPANHLAPFQWSYQDVEALTFADDAVDFCVVHSGLHHCYSPHRGLLEMYRVAQHGLLLFEPYDNLFSRLGIKLGFGQEFECAAVVYNDFSYGGVGNSAIPNYVMRWTEREIKKTINSYAPYGEHQFMFFHRMRIPWIQLRGRRGRFYFVGALVAAPLLHLIGRILPRQCNNFAAVVLKPNVPDDLHPWLQWNHQAIEPDVRWLKDRYEVGTDS